MSWYVTHTLYRICSALGWIIGLRPWYEEYTPPRFREVAVAGGVGKGKQL